MSYTVALPDTANKLITGDRHLLHAYPDNSDIALCGARKTKDSQPTSGHRCTDCLIEAGRRNWRTR